MSKPLSVAQGADIPGYELGPVIGRGSFSTVFRAEANGTTVAVKLQDDRLVGTESVVEQFRREAMLLASLNHPAFPDIYEVDRVDGRMYLAMEYIEGQTLDSMLESGPLADARAAEIGAQLVDALVHIHKRGVFHRDVKPANIVVEPDQPVRLVDFGLAAQERRRGEEELTAGTPTYAAPEQLGVLERPVDGRADLYSVGVLLFESLTGSPPFDAKETHKLIRQHSSVEAPPLRDRNPDASAALEAIVARLLAKDPDDRYQTATGLRADLEGFDRLDELARRGVELALGNREDPGSRLTWGRLVGREAESAALDDCWEAASGGTGRAVLVAGSAGSGKSHLVGAFAERASRTGLILRGSCAEDDPVPLGPLQQIVRRQTRRLRRLLPDRRRRAEQVVADCLDGLEGAFDGSFPLLARLAEQTDGEGEAGADQPVPEALCELLIRLARAVGPTLLLLDDVQWLDDATRWLLRSLGERLDEAPLLVVGAGRSAGCEGFERVARRATFDRLTLEPLDRSGLRQLVTGKLGSVAFPDELLDELQHRSDGNPLLAIEYLHAMLETGLLVPDWGQWRFDRQGLEHVELSGGVQAIVDRRVDRLDPGLRRPLTVASLVGTRFRLALLYRVLDAEADQVDRCIDEALRLQLVEQTQEDGYAFLHDRIRRALWDRLDDRERARLHQKIAEGLDDRPAMASDPAAYPFELARHYAEGLVEQTPGRAFQANLEAGRLALVESAFQQAYDFLGTAAEIGLPREGSTGAEPTIQLHRLLGEAAARTGRIEEAIVEMEAAIREIDDPVREAEFRSFLAQIHIWDSFHAAAARREVERAFDALGKPPPTSRVGLVGSALWHGSLGLVIGATGWGFGGASDRRRRELTIGAELHRQAAQVAYWQFDPLRMLLLSLRALPSALRVGPSEVLAILYVHYAVAAASLGSKRLSEYLGRRGQAFGRQVGDRRVEATTEVNRAVAIHMRGEVEEAADLSRRYLRDRRNWLDAAIFTQGCGDLSWNLQLRGEDERALRWVDRAISKVEEVGAQRGIVYLPTRRAACLVTLGRGSEAQTELAAARDLAAEAAEDPYRQANYLSHLILFHRENGELEEACRAVDRYLGLELEPRRLPFHMRNAFVFMGYVYVDRLAEAPDGRGGEAKERWTDRLEEVVDLLAEIDVGHPTLRAHRRLLEAVALGRAGEASSAESALQQAARLAREHANPWVLFEVACHRAHRLADQGHEAMARLEADRARGVARRMGWRRRLERLDRQLPIGVEGAAREAGASAPASSVGAAGRTSLQTLQVQRHLDALLRVSLAATEAADPDDQIRFVLDELVAILSAERGAVFLCDDEGELQMAAARDAGRGDLQDPVFSSTAIARVEQTGQPLVMAATSAGDEAGLRAAESVIAEDIRSIGAVPLVREGESVGLLYLDSRLASGVFSEDDIDILAGIAGQVPLILQRVRAARLETEVASERQQRRLAERLRRLTSQMHDTRDIPKICRLAADGVADFLPVVDARAFLCREGRLREVVLPEEAEASGGSFDQRDQTTLPDKDAEVRRLFERRGLGAFDFGEADVEGLVGPKGRQMVIPLPSSEGLVGALLLESYSTERFEQQDLQLARAFGGQAGLAVEHARLVTTDGLTGLYNRRYFFELGERQFRQARRYDVALTALMFDIDEFKAVNDTHGHAVGDVVLRSVAARCRGDIRSVDILGRYGGEEFALLLPHTEADEASETVAERIRATIDAEPVDVDGTEILVTISVGVAGAEPADDTLDDLLERADSALYRAKNAGRNRVVCASGADGR